MKYMPNLKSTTGKSLVWLTLLLAMAAWIILLVALSILQNKCASSNTPSVINSVFQFTENGCSKFFGYQWFIISFEIFILFLIFMATAGNVVHQHRVALCTLLAIVTVLLMDLTNSSYLARNRTSGSLRHRMNALFAGALITSVCNGFLIMVMGSHDERATYVEDREVGGFGRKPHGETTTMPATTMPGTTTYPTAGSTAV